MSQHLHLPVSRKPPPAMPQLLPLQETRAPLNLPLPVLPPLLSAVFPEQLGWFEASHNPPLFL